MSGQEAAAAASPTEVFRAARDVLLRHRTDWAAAVREFRWPNFEHFNWALDWFDTLAEPAEQGRPRTALRIVGPGGPETDRLLTFRELATRSSQVANWLRSVGVRRDDPVLVMLGNRQEVWEMLLAAVKLGAVVVPTYTTATPAELQDRLTRGAIGYVVTEAELTGRFHGLEGSWVGVRVGAGDASSAGWLPYEETERASGTFVPDGPTGADDVVFRYFTSGTTSKPKMVEHTHTSYPVGHLSGMYWNGVRPGDIHLNVSSPGWAKHAWSSFFVPWNAEATVVALEGSRSTAEDVLDVLRTRGVTTFCAPPTVWRAMAVVGLGERPALLRETMAAGEPLEPGLIRQVKEAWGLDLRDGYGQTETTGQIGNPPGRVVVPGSMGVPLPGCPVVLIDPETGEPVPDGEPGEICLDLRHRPVGLMRGYADDERRTDKAFAGGYYHSGDLAVRTEEGGITYLSRTDDMFKSFDHRISPRELEQALLEHPMVADAAVVAVPDPVGLWVPKAYVVAAPGHRTESADARELLEHARSVLPAEKWVWLLEFVATLPRTASGKIRRTELKGRTEDQATGVEYRLEDVC
ncbi:AMP-binding protein [Sphaerimonospora cavernae]|uniref:AMP-binding protein n=1 Tax=Sphaerimonospora cavernae TaxID=1740611 RepID=A0ABV6UBA1_9ACTN